MKINTIKALDTVYRKGERPGHILYWRAEYKGNQVRACSGIVGGTEKIGAWTTVEGTNIGKANERTPEQQAIATANQKRDDKLRHGYHASIDDIEESKYFQPMLADKYNPDKPPKFPVRVQPKLNGERCTITAKEMRSRNGELIVSCPHLQEAFKNFFKKCPNARIDGELYNHDLREHLNRLRSLISKQAPTAAELTESAAFVQFHVYDGFLCEEEMKNPLRFGRLWGELGPSSKVFTAGVRKVIERVAKSAADLERYYREFLQQGYEGAMLRLPGPYVCKRTKDLLKYKPRYDAEFTCTGTEDGKGKRVGRLSKVFCVTHNGVKFTANVKWKDPEKARLWEIRDKLVGKKVTVSYAYLTEYGKPFHNYLEKIHGL